MNGLKYIITITHREFAEKYIDFVKSASSNFVNVELCKGTATDGVLNTLGLERTEKVMIKSAVTEKDFPAVKEWLIKTMRITDSGNGITAVIPIDGLGGESCKQRLIGDKNLDNSEENVMNTNLSKFVLILAIADKGSSELIMNAARTAEATGGTVVKAQGTGADIAKFFGVSITEEKEITYIVAPRDKRDRIMYAIMNAESFKEDLHGIVFSLPVESVLGIKNFEEIL